MTFSGFDWLKVLCLTLATLHTAAVLGRFWPEPRQTIVVDAVYLAVVFCSALLVTVGWYGERQKADGQTGLGWAALSLFSLLLAESWMLQYDLPGREIPDYSLADPFYFLSYLAMAVTLLRFNGMRGWSLGAWGALLDSLTVVVVAGELAWVNFLGAAMAEPGVSLLQQVINLTYVGCDLLLLGLALLTLRRRFGLPMTLFTGGLLAFVVADLLYFALTMNDRYRAGTLLDSLWAWGTAMQALGIVWTWQRREWGLRGPIKRLGLWGQDELLAALPYAAMTINCVLLLQQSREPALTGLHLEYWSVTLFAIVLLRQALTNRERDMLHRRLLQQAHELQHQALHDALTGLPNRAAFEQALHQEVEEPTAATLALLYLDLNGFKQINDTLGHAAGDQTLQWVAQCLRGAVPPEASVSRLGGDEFTVLLPTASAQRAQEVAADLHQCLKTPVPGLTQPMQVSASIGIAVMSLGGGQNADALWHEADQAMYRIKHAGRAVY